MGGSNRMLYAGIFVASIAYIYTLYHKNKSGDAFSVEQTVLDSWKKLIQPPALVWKKVVMGINCNVDLVVSGTFLLSRLNASAGSAKDHEHIDNLNDFQEAFSHFFSRGLPAERYTSDGQLFQTAVEIAERWLHRNGAEYIIGGNAALMAQKMASSYMKTKVLLVGPIGPRSKALLHPNVIIQNSTKISKDEIHLIMEFKTGEIWGDHVAPSSSRFITSHDVFSSSAVVIDMFFNTIAAYKPDLVVLSGVHLLEFQPREMWQEKLKVLKRNLGQLSTLLPLHFEMGSTAEFEYTRNILHRIIPMVDSLGLNEMELASLAQVGGGPYADQNPAVAGTIHVHKAVEILHWLISNFGKDFGNPQSKRVGFRLQRIHFHCLTYHLIVTKGPDWSNSASALAAGAAVAGIQACGVDSSKVLEEGMAEIRTGDTFLLDKEQNRIYRFNPHQPLISWMRNDILFIFTPALVCRSPLRTVGLGDAVSATGLGYSQFYRFEK